MTARSMFTALGCLLAVTGCDRVFGLERPPEPDAPPPPPPQWLAVASGAAHTCGVKVDQTLWCWGENARGETGLPDTTEEITTPTRVSDARWTTLASHYDHSCAIDTAGVVWCWGANPQRAIGAMSSADHLPLTRVLDDAIAVATGSAHTCAIRGDQTLWCWGRNTEGQLALPISTSEPPRESLTNLRWTQIGAGLYHTCGLTTDGALMCWGENTNHQVLVGGAARYSEPQAIEPGTVWVDLAVGQYHTCAVRLDGTMHCYGFNSHGQLGSDAISGMGGDIVTGEPPRTWTRVFAALHHTCAVRDDETLWCFGDNSQGDLALADLETARTPTKVTGGAGTWTTIAIGGAHLCGIDGMGAMWCAGSNGVGAVGDGTGGSRLEPSQVAGTWSAVAVGSGSVCARDQLGAVWCWGLNTEGQVGDGTRFPRQKPVRILAGATTGLLAVGTLHACATRSATDRALMCWGNNIVGQLGTGPNVGPEQLPRPSAITDAIALTAGSGTCAISLMDPANTSDDRLSCWGSNAYGQLAVAPDDVPHGDPVPIPQTPWQAVTSGLIHTCGQRGAGLYCWGDNSYGQRGTTTMPDVGVVSTTTKFATLGGFNSCLIALSDRLECWGRNDDGQVGNSTVTNQTAPQPIGGDSWKGIALGLRHTCGVRSDNSLWCWGDNSRGQLGNNSRTDARAPIQIGTDTDWRSLAAGGNETCAIKADDSLWCWGANGSGQIGDGSAWSPTFVRISP